MKAKARHLLILPALLFGLVTSAQVAKIPKPDPENPQKTLTLASISLNGKPTVDDGQLRKLVAFLELMAYDLFAE